MSIRCMCGMMLGLLGLLAVGCRDSTGRLIAQLEEGDPLVRRQAARALAEEHGGRADVVAALTRAMQDSDLEVCELAGSSLGAMGAAAASSLSCSVAWVTSWPRWLSKFRNGRGVPRRPLIPLRGFGFEGTLLDNCPSGPDGMGHSWGHS